MCSRAVYSDLSPHHSSRSVVLKPGCTLEEILKFTIILAPLQRFGFNWSEDGGGHQYFTLTLPQWIECVGGLRITEWSDLILFNDSKWHNKIWWFKWKSPALSPSLNSRLITKGLLDISTLQSNDHFKVSRSTTFWFPIQISSNVSYLRRWHMP